MIVHLFFQFAHPAFKGHNVLLDRVGQVNVIEIDMRGRAFAADNAAGVADHGAVGRHLLEHHRQRADFAAAADCERPSTFAPAPMTTLSPMVGWRLPTSLPVPPRVTP